jgi:hypothetical protein
VLRYRQPFAVEELQGARPPERVGSDLQYPPPPARLADRSLHVNDGDLATAGFPQLHQVDVRALGHRGDHQHGGIAVE